MIPSFSCQRCKNLAASLTLNSSDPLKLTHICLVVAASCAISCQPVHARLVILDFLLKELALSLVISPVFVPYVLDQIMT